MMRIIDKSVIVQRILSLTMIPSIMPVQALPVNDQSSADESDCVRMTDEKLEEVNDMIKELTDFVDTLADKHKDFDLKLVKLDIDRRQENEADDEGALLEVFVNDCANKAQTHRSSKESSEDKTNYEIKETKYNKDEEFVDSDRTTETADGAQSFQDLVDGELFEIIIENADTDDTTESSNTNTNKKVTKKSKYKINTSLSSDTNSVREDKRSVSRKGRSSTTNVNHKHKSTTNTESDSNVDERTSTNNVYSENDETSVNKKNEYQTTTNVENDKNYSKTSTTDDTYTEKNSKSSESKEINNSQSTRSVNNSSYDEKSSTSNNNKVSSTNYENNDSSNNQKTTTNNESERSEFNKSQTNVNNNNNDETTSTRNNSKESATNYENNNSSNNQKTTTTNTESKLSEFNINENQLIESLKQIIRNEIKNAISDSKDKDFKNTNTRADFNENNYYKHDVRSRSNDNYRMSAKPELVSLNFPDDLQLLNELDRVRCKRIPWLVYLQQPRQQVVYI